MSVIDKYTDPSFPGSFGGLTKFYKEIKSKDTNFQTVKEQLLDEPAYTLHTPTTRKFKSYQIIVSGIGDTWQADLIDIKKLAQYNDMFKYLLSVIDVFTKRAWVIALKDKTGDTILEAFKEIFKDTKPKKIHVDQGTEFINSKLKAYLTSLGINLYYTNSNHKACMVERFNRTFKEKMYRMFEYNGNKRYIDDLQKLVDSYNNTYHRSIKTKPNLVNEKNEDEIWNNLYGYKKNEGSNQVLTNLKFKLGDLVRIPRYKSIFEKGYEKNWTEEIFKVKRIIPIIPPQYIVEDLEQEEIKGRFNEAELQKVYKLNDDYEVEYVIKTRTNKGKKQQFVKWKGYPEKFNSWIDYDSNLK